MKLSDKKKWGIFIYGLLYPGIVGSMIYELIPPDKNFTFDSHYIIPTIIKVIITLFYSVDFLHLYGDMNALADDKERTPIFLICDVLTSICLFGAFVAVKYDCYGSGIFFISLIPLIFLSYKYKKTTWKDRLFLFIYVDISFVIAILYFSNSLFNWKCTFMDNSQLFLMIFVIFSFFIYAYYVFYFYENLLLDNSVMPKNLIARIKKTLKKIFLKNLFILLKLFSPK